jgi:proteasome lid subunit RPN8/RPN11
MDDERWKSAAMEHAKAEYPNEACGIVIVARGRKAYLPARNIAAAPQSQFCMAPEDYAAAEAAGEPVAIFHSHTSLPPQPSPADLAACEATGLTWYIANPATGEWHHFDPSGYRAPLVGRPWGGIGALDCYSLVKDWYAEERNQVLPEYARTPGFAERGEDLYGQAFEAAGFRQLKDGEPLETGDIIMFQTARAPVANHAGVYIGDGKFLHHQVNRLSSREVYGGYWLKHTRRVVRYAGDQA